MEFTPLRFTAEELGGLLGQGREREGAGLGADAASEVQGAPEGAEPASFAENAVLDLVSPVLGEFQLRERKCAERASKHEYYGHADLEALNQIALLVQDYYGIVARECSDLLSFNYQRVQQSAANGARIAAVKGSKAKVVNTLGRAGETYSALDVHYYRA